MIEKILRYTPNAIIRRQKSKQLREDLRFIKSVYGVKVDFRRLNSGDPRYIKEVQRLNLSSAASATRDIREEISKYPTEVIEYSDLKKIRMVKGFRDGSGDYPGGEAFTERGLFFITARGGQRGAFHHELFHETDAAKSRKTIPIPFLRTYFRPFVDLFRNNMWANLNSKKFRYSQKHFKPSSDEITDGFARTYGMVNELEDKATVAQMIMNETKKFKARITWDEVLKVKGLNVMEIWYEASGKKMGPEYFKDLLSGKVKPGYWDNKSN